MPADVLCVDVCDASTDRRTAGKVELVCGAVDRIVLDGGGYVESGLFEAEAHPARSREQIHG
jgi:hypothetical protein